MEAGFSREALFTGMTGNAFKLGTVLTLGWFWPRIAGCSVLYRGGSMGTIDFDNILAVIEADVSLIDAPGYVRHNSGEVYFYVVRRVNGCGEQEHTSAGAVKVSIGADGEPALPEPNSVFGLKAEQTAGNRVRLIWYYCPLGQGQKPVCFRVYCDGGTGQIDYGNSIAAIYYGGRKFYQYQSEPFDVGTYLFAVRAEDAGGTGNRSLARIEIQLDATNPGIADILSFESI